MSSQPATIRIRPASPADIPKIVTLMHETHAEHDFSPYPPPNEIALHGHLLTCMIPTNGTVLAVEAEGKIVGVTTLLYFYFEWNPSVRCLTNRLFTVAKEYRKTNAADLLIKKAREFAAEQNIEHVYIGVMTDEDAELKDRFMRIKGGKYLGGNFSFFPL